jgi:hypothetical protein
LKSSDPLEQTEEADDITGSNNCPMHQRITAIGMLPLNERAAFLGVELRYFRRNDKIIEEKRGYIPSKAKPVWAIFNGNLITEPTMAALSRRIKKHCGAMHNNKQDAKKRDPNAKEATIGGIRYGWGEPPQV